MKNTTALLVTAASVMLICAILLSISLLSPAGVQASRIDQELPQVRGTLSVPDLRRPGLLLRPTATPTPHLAIIAPIRIAPPLLTRIAPQLHDPNDIGQVIQPLFTPDVIWAACGDTLPLFEAVHANAPGPGEPCAFIIEGHPESRLFLSTRPLIADMTLNVILTDDAGQILAEMSAVSPDSEGFLAFTLPATGRATLWIVASTPGPFEMRVSMPLYVTSLPLCGGNLTYGQQVHHMVPVAEAQCVYTFTGQGEDAIVITMDRDNVDSSLDPLLELRDEAETILASNNDTDGSVNAMLSFVLPAAGKYTIAARDYDNTNTGPYILSLSLAPEQGGTTDGGVPTPPPAGCGGALSTGTSVNGRIATLGAKCVYTLFGTKDRTVTLSLVKTDGALDTYLELYPATYPNGSRLAYNDDNSIVGGLNSQITNYKFLTTASYRVVVSAYANNTAGSYKLTASQP